MSYKVDLHTHSVGSPDGGLTLADYQYFLQNNLLDYIAITDHDSIDMALKIKADLGDMGRRIIIGEEIMTSEGEVVGLFLSSAITPGQTPLTTIQAIKKQAGLVYIPHPFETVRSGLTKSALDTVATQVDIMETWNGRAIFQNRSTLARQWAAKHSVAGAASSDTHGQFGWGHTYTVVDHVPDVENLSRMLRAGIQVTGTVGLGIVYPKLNRLLKRFR